MLTAGDLAVVVQLPQEQRDHDVVEVRKDAVDGLVAKAIPAREGAQVLGLRELRHG
jgi:hypothetical protein